MVEVVVLPPEGISKKCKAGKKRSKIEITEENGASDSVIEELDCSAQILPHE